jgi:hypothetical protein
MLICYSNQLKYGGIERLKTQDGMPILAEVVEQKIEFADPMTASALTTTNFRHA